jgi:aminomethyltransferase
VRRIFYNKKECSRVYSGLFYLSGGIIVENTVTAKKTPLYNRHVEAGGKIVEFAGYFMPIQYEGIIAEHEHVRTKTGIFDLTHMGEIKVTGKNAPAFVNYIITNEVASLPTGAIVYTAICREDGGILDDALAYRTDYGVYLVVNASNKDKIFNWMLKQSENWNDLKIEDLSDQTALIAVQGPDAEKIVQKITPINLGVMEYYTFTEGRILDTEGIVSRTGYTGEDGFEIYINNENAESVWDTLVTEGRPYDLKPIGLGARDTLRLEAKYVLYGNELSENINPLEAGIKFAVNFDKDDFIGKNALQRINENKPLRKLIGFELIKPGVPRKDYPVQDKSGREIGLVTSGTHSPSLKKAIGLALVERESVKRGDEIDILIRGKKVQAKVIKTPFYTGTVKNKKSSKKED